MKYLIPLMFITSLYADIKIVFHGFAFHKNSEYQENTYIYDADTGEHIYTTKEKHNYNNSYGLIGIEYKKKLWSINAVTYKNSFYMRTNAFYVSSYWPTENFDFKLSVGIASGYSMNTWEENKYRPMIMPSISVRKGFMELEAGFLGTALVGMVKIIF